MRVGIIQSAYVPWRGYFDFIASVDLFIIFDDVAFGNKMSWRRRNQIKTPNGLIWMSVPVKCSRATPIDEVLLENTTPPWQEAHRTLLQRNLGRAPFFSDAVGIWEEAVGVGHEKLSEFNVSLMYGICHYLGIATPMTASRPLNATKAKTERLIELLTKVGATSYLCGPTAKGYIEEELFREAGIGLEYKSYDYLPYPQLWGEFVGTVSVLDLIANTGPESRLLCRSASADTVVF